MARETVTAGVWHGRTAALGCIVHGVIQAEAAEAARDN
jgi:hypothetical protein